jgi:hypothetical protein
VPRDGNDFRADDFRADDLYPYKVDIVVSVKTCTLNHDVPGSIPALSIYGTL